MTDQQRKKWDRLAAFARHPNTIPHGEIEVPAELIVAIDDELRKFAVQNIALIAENDYAWDAIERLNDLLSPEQVRAELGRARIDMTTAEARVRAALARAKGQEPTP